MSRIPDSNDKAKVYSDEELYDSDVATGQQRRLPSSSNFQPHHSSHYQYPTTPTKNRRRSSSSYSPYPATSPPASPNRPVTRGWAAATHQDIDPDRLEIIPGANLRRQINVTPSKLRKKAYQCQYVHPLTKEQCDYVGAWEVNWSEEHDWHWFRHAAKEYRMMVRKTLGMGQGTIIKTRKLFEEYRNKLVICDICNEAFSKKEILADHKEMVHGVPIPPKSS